jgi:hypothetical protein
VSPLLSLDEQNWNAVVMIGTHKRLARGKAVPPVPAQNTLVTRPLRIRIPSPVAEKPRQEPALELGD